MVRTTIETLLKTQTMLESRRHNFDSYWQVAKEVYWPDAADFNIHRTQGTARSQAIFDGTGVIALERFGAVMESLLTPRGSIWHNLRASNEELNEIPEVKEYFATLNRILFAVRSRPSARFYAQKEQDYKSLGCTGNSCTRVELSKDKRGLSYRSVHVGDVWIAIDDEGAPDTIYHKRKLTALEAVSMWGKRATRSARQSMERGDIMDEHEYLHVVQPRDLATWDPERLDARGRRFESFEICVEDKEPILTDGGEESDGYHEQPYVYARFTTNSQEDYGRGPSMWTLPANLTLQSMKRSTIKQGEKAVSPPLLSHAMQFKGDGRGTLNLRANALNPGWLDANGNPRVRPFDNQFKYDIAREMIEDERAAIRDAHFVTLFQILVDTAQMTATEAMIRAREKAALIGPTIGRQQSESLGPMIQRELGLLDRAKLLPPPPPVLLEAGDEYEVEYESEATALQRESELNRVRAWFEDLALIQEVTGDRTVGLVANGKETARYMANGRNVPPELVMSERRVKAQVDEMAAAAEEQAQAEQLPNQARAARDFAAAQAAA
ncbi:MAG: hypothetical protein KC616_21625 [Myxococcales bacterium]|nr:hypothetical protein [Myxococcales bacterium]